MTLLDWNVVLMNTCRHVNNVESCQSNATATGTRGDKETFQLLQLTCDDELKKKKKIG